jgi:hypothetical protein
MLKLSSLALVLLAGCATTPREPEVIRVPVEVKVPVEVRCSPELPEKPVARVEKPIPGNLRDKGVALMADLEDTRAYAAKLEAALIACMQPRKEPTP